MEKGYFTLSAYGEDRFTERKSVFIGSACPVKDEREAVDFIASVRSKYSDATHNVYAYILREGNTARFSDDGEPHGTAGLPVLDVLRKEQLFDCAVVATRYFGGILLGAGGLVRAYSAAAKVGVDAAGIVFLKPFDVFTLRTDYGRYNKIAKLLSEYRVKVAESVYAEDVFLKASIAHERADAFLTSLREATNDSVKASLCGTVFDSEE